MVCKKCGGVAPEDGTFCPYCGRKLDRKPSARTRANGEGSIYKCGDKWRVEKTLGYTLVQLPDGSTRQKRESISKSGFETKLAAREYLNKLDLAAPTSHREGHNTNITLKKLYDEWLPTIVNNVVHSTVNCYNAGFKLFMDLWDLPMSELDIDDLQDCLDDSDAGRQTQKNAKTALTQIFDYGIPRDCVLKDRNLARFLKVHADGGVSHPGFDDIQLSRIMKAAPASHKAMLVYCHCYLGFRPSALIQLRIEGYRADERAIVGGIKTEAGRSRTVTVSPKIQRYIDRLIDGRSEGYIFRNLDGKAFNIKTYRAMFYEVLESVGIENPVDEDGRHKYTPHSCRHTFATLMKRVEGADKDKLELIGHTSAEMLRYYQDVSFEDLRKITNAI